MDHEQPVTGVEEKRQSRRRLNIDFKKLAGETYEEEDLDLGQSSSSSLYANRHIPLVIERSFSPPTNILQVVTDGSTLTYANLTDPSHPLTIHRPILVTDSPTSIGMKVPLPSKHHSAVTIREIGEKIGMDHPVTVMDVRTQDELEGWNFCDICEYFEDDDRKYRASISPSRSRPRAQQRSYVPRVLNQISLEFSLTPLASDVQSPQFVRDMDWIDHMWPKERRMAGDYPRVQYYCLTSTAGCYTDFHVDFGGTSVWYHVLSGKKVFLLIPPTPNNLKLYEQWLCRKDQNDIFFPDMTGEVVEGQGGLAQVENCVKIVLEMGQTFIIPTGWIHAVYTPDDSIVLGGNFLHGFDIKGQLDVHCLETRTRVPAKFRFPSFVQLMFYGAKEYYKRLRAPETYGIVHPDELRGLPYLMDALKSWNVRPGGDADRYGSVSYVETQCIEEISKLFHVVCDMSSLLESMRDELDRNTLRNAIEPQKTNNFATKLKLKIKKQDKSNSSPNQVTKEEGVSEPSKSKLKLKLSLSPAKSNATVTEEKTDDIPDIKIHVNQEETISQGVGYVQRQSRSIGSDLVSMRSHPKDDEWVPVKIGSSQKRSSNSQNPKTETSRSRQRQKTTQALKVSEKPTVLQESKMGGKSNSRSRLMKKLKF